MAEARQGTARARQRSNSATTVTHQRIVVRDLTLACHIGVSERERAHSQRLRVNVELDVEPQRPLEDDPAKVVDYGQIVPEIRRVCSEIRPRLLESLAEAIAEACFFDSRTRSARVRVEKLDRYSDAAGIGIEIERRRRRR